MESCLIPSSLWEEISELAAHGVKINSKNLLISECAHLVFPYHKIDRRTAGSFQGNTENRNHKARNRAGLW